MSTTRQSYNRVVKDHRDRQLLMIFTKCESTDVSGTANWDEVEFYSQTSDVLGQHHWEPSGIAGKSKESLILSIMFEAIADIDAWEMGLRKCT